MEKKISAVLKKAIFLLFKFLSVFYIAKYAIPAIREIGLRNTISSLKGGMANFSIVLPMVFYERIWLGQLESFVEKSTKVIDRFFCWLGLNQLLRRLGINYGLPYRPDFLQDEENFR